MAARPALGGLLPDGYIYQRSKTITCRFHEGSVGPRNLPAWYRYPGAAKSQLGKAMRQNGDQQLHGPRSGRVGDITTMTYDSLPYCFGAFKNIIDANPPVTLTTNIHHRFFLYATLY